MNKEFDIEFVEDTVAGDLDPVYVDEVEKMIGLRFPPFFLDFLKAHNGGVPVKRIFKMGEQEKVVDFFLCLVADYHTSEFGDTDIGVVWSRIEDRLNSNLIPFVALFAGDFLCFDYKENPENPKIVFWYHERSEEGRPYLIPVADSFQDFLKMLYAE